MIYIKKKKNEFTIEMNVRIPDAYFAWVNKRYFLLRLELWP